MGCLTTLYGCGGLRPGNLKGYGLKSLGVVGFVEDLVFRSWIALVVCRPDVLVPGQQKQARRCSPEAPAPCAPPPLIAFVPALIRRFFKQDCQLLTTRTFKCNAKQKRASDLPAQSIFVKTLEHRHGDGTDNNVLLWLRALSACPCHGQVTMRAARAFSCL